MDDFDDIGNLFGFPLPGNVMERIMRGVIGSSRVTRALYEEHVRNGFSEDQALRLVFSLQRDIVHGLAGIGAAMGKELVPKPERPEGES